MTDDERLEAWMAERHNPNWIPGPRGGRIVHRDELGRFTRKPS